MVRAWSEQESMGMVRAWASMARTCSKHGQGILRACSEHGQGMLRASEGREERVARGNEPGEPTCFVYAAAEEASSTLKAAHVTSDWHSLS